MDLDELRKLSEEGQNEKEKKVLQLCNPQQIAQELLSKLEANAAYSAKEGHRSTSSYVYLWREVRDKKSYDPDPYGPLISVASYERIELAKILLNMVRKHISDSNIQLDLLTEDDCVICGGLQASMSW